MKYNFQIRTNYQSGKQAVINFSNVECESDNSAIRRIVKTFTNKYAGGSGQAGITVYNAQKVAIHQISVNVNLGNKITVDGVQYNPENWIEFFK